MNTQARKQREWQEREERILDVARQMLLERGYLGMTMDRIAEEIEYSKGTIYQHFSCKEDVLATLCTQSNAKRCEMFERASAFRGRPRERMMGIGEAFQLFVRLNPHHFRVEQIIMAASIGDKVSPERLAMNQASEGRCISIASGVVRDAISQGDLELPPDFSPEELMFGLWTMSFGVFTMATSADFLEGLEAIGIPAPFATLWRNSAALLDGYNWRPLSSEWDYMKTRERIQQEIFPDEHRKGHAA